MKQFKISDIDFFSNLSIDNLCPHCKGSLTISDNYEQISCIKRSCYIYISKFVLEIENNEIVEYEISFDEKAFNTANGQAFIYYTIYTNSHKNSTQILKSNLNSQRTEEIFRSESFTHFRNDLSFYREKIFKILKLAAFH